MLRGVEKLRAELDRICRPRTATVRSRPGGERMEVTIGDELDLIYAGELRRVRVLAIMPTGLRCWDEDKSAMRCFKFTKIGVSERPPETDEAAQG